MAAGRKRAQAQVATLCLAALAAGAPGLFERPAAAAEPQTLKPIAGPDFAGRSATGRTVTLPTFAPAPSLTGFRSARFGMGEKALRKAILTDFGTTSPILAHRSPTKRTRALSLRVADILPGGGLADLSYTMGFRSKRLMQIGMSWSKASDAKLTPTDLTDNGVALARHFATATQSGNYLPSTVRTNVLVPGGLLLFRGEDARGRTTMLMLQGEIEQGGEAARRELVPQALALIYAIDPHNPDILTLKKSDF